MINWIRPCLGRPPGRFRAFLALFAAFGLVSCTAVNAYYKADKAHHTPEGFRNNYLTAEIGGSFLKWQWERMTRDLPKPPANGYRFPMMQPDVGWLQANRTETAMTWIGHSTVLVQLAGINILTDPIFSERASPVQWFGPQRKTKPALTLSQLPRIDVVMISHNHYDHLDRASVVALNRQAGGSPLFLVPLGIKPWMEAAGISNVRELDWWDKTTANGLEVTFVPVQHWSARSIGDRFETLWGGWTMRTVAPGSAPFSAFFAGDTGYSQDFSDIGKRFGSFDVALLPIGAYEPRWFMKRQHVDPDEALKVHRDIRAKRSIGIHWGTFELTDEPLDEPPKRLQRALDAAGTPAGVFHVPKHGETMRF